MGALNRRAEAIIPITAGENLTDKEGYFYKLDGSNEAVLCSAVTDVPHGIILQGAAADKVISAQPFGNGGTVEVKLGADVTDLRKLLQLRADATAGPNAGTGARTLVAMPLETGVADEKIECVLIPPRAIAAGAGVQIWPIQIFLAAITSAVDVVTEVTPGFAFELVSATFVVTQPVTTGSKLATLNFEIGSTNVTGGTVALTSANCTPLGVKVAGAAITAGYTGSATDTISVEASSVTAFAEGSGVLLLAIRNLDTANLG